MRIPFPRGQISRSNSRPPPSASMLWSLLWQLTSARWSRGVYVSRPAHWSTSMDYSMVLTPPSCLPPVRLRGSQPNSPWRTTARIYPVIREVLSHCGSRRDRWNSWSTLSRCAIRPPPRAACRPWPAWGRRASGTSRRPTSRGNASLCAPSSMSHPTRTRTALTTSSPPRATLSWTS
jgi:hypothetical protein